MADEELNEFRSLIIDSYQESASTSAIIESCARHFGWLGWDLEKQGERANIAFEGSVDADEARLSASLALLAEILEGQRAVLLEYQQLLAVHRELIMKNLMVDGGLRRIDKLLARTEQWQKELKDNRGIEK